MKHFICSDSKPAWFEKLYRLNIAIGMADSQEKQKMANSDFTITMNTFVFIRSKPSLQQC